MKDHLYYLVDANVAVPLRNPFKVQKKFMETTNFVPDMLSSPGEISVMKTDAIISKGETWMPEFDFLMENDSVSRMKSPFSPSESFLRFVDEADDDNDEDWDEDEEEDWDEDDEEDDEDWDEDDEEWDEDEDWDEDDEDEDDEDWDEDGEEEA